MLRAIRTLRDALALCPICTEIFNSDSRIPRRLPCCGQAVCQPCLSTNIGDRRTFPCPLCRGQVNLQDGPKSLPKDMTLLRFLDALRTQQDAVPMCTNCPDHHKAMAKCEACGVYLCESCVSAHTRKISTKDHKLLLFEELQTISLRPRKPRGSIMPEPPPLPPRKPNHERLVKVETRMEKLTGMLKNIDLSENSSTNDINHQFDEIIDEVQERRAVLLSEVGANANDQRETIKKALGAYQTLKDKLISASRTSSTSLPKEDPEDVDVERVGVTFTEVNIQQLLSRIKSAGRVRVVSYRPTKRPSFVPEDAVFDAIKFAPEDVSNSADGDAVMSKGKKEITCPHLELDRSTASVEIQSSRATGMVSNIRGPVLDTGCRLQSWGRALTMRPILVDRGQVAVFATRVEFTVKELLETGMCMWETALTTSPVDANYSQTIGLSVRIVTCSKHKNQLCLWVAYDGNMLSDTPLIGYKVGTSGVLNLCIVIDRDANQLHLVDFSVNKVVTSIGNAVFDRPFWVMAYFDAPSFTEMKNQIISGRQLELTPVMKDILFSLTSKV